MVKLISLHRDKENIGTVRDNNTEGKIDNRMYSPKEISAMILQKI
jgi:hypothetical protein